MYKPIGTSELDKLSITITLPSATGDIVGLKLNHHYTKVKDLNINVYYSGARLKHYSIRYRGDGWEHFPGGLVTQLENIYLIVRSIANTNKGFGRVTSINNCVAGSERDTSETKTFGCFFTI